MAVQAMRSMADQVIRYFGDGATATLTTYASSYAESTRTRTNTPTTYTVHVLVGRRVMENLDGALVKTDEQRVTLSASDLPAGVAPTTDSKLTIGTVAYTITDVEPFMPDGATVVAYDLMVKVKP